MQAYRSRHAQFLIVRVGPLNVDHSRGVESHSACDIRDSSTSLAITIEGQNIFCRSRSCLYIRRLPHQERERVIARPEAGFLSPAVNDPLAALYV